MFWIGIIVGAIVAFILMFVWGVLVELREPDQISL